MSALYWPEQFAEILLRNGFDVWFDKDDLQPGERWLETLESAIQGAPPRSSISVD
jgi:hypothetical protein